MLQKIPSDPILMNLLDGFSQVLNRKVVIYRQRIVKLLIEVKIGLVTVLIVQVVEVVPGEMDFGTVNKINGVIEKVVYLTRKDFRLDGGVNRRLVISLLI